MRGEDRFEFAATTIGIMLLMLRNKGYTDAEIVKMLGRGKVKEILQVLKGGKQCTTALDASK